MSVQGLKELKANIKAHKAATAKGIRKGLYKAGLFLQRESMKIVPIDTGVLRASAATRAEGKGFDTAVIVSYGTDYGVYVHEDLEASHKPGKRAKFLEQPLRDNREKIAQIVRDEIEKEGGAVL